jgi:hypothetical protein
VSLKFVQSPVWRGQSRSRSTWPQNELTVLLVVAAKPQVKNKVTRYFAEVPAEHRVLTTVDP